MSTPKEVQFDLTGRTAVVTGAATGIGRAVAAYLAEAGATVALLDVDADALEAARTGALAGALTVWCDVADSAMVTTALDAILQQTGRVDVLVNNAGILRDGMLWKLTDDMWDRVLGVHLTGAFNMTRAVVPTMREAGYGRIINVTSYTGLHGNLGQANYAAAKAGIIGLTRTAAKELARFGITVNAVSPNARTQMVDAIPEDRRAELAALSPMNRFGEPKEMAPPIAFLASAEAGYITGVVLPVDGGLSI
jgi:3-oxoacyl-[acyl-carrier protein] reductase